jgi:hypothetical protein
MGMADSVSPYAYVANNPVNAIDPYGLLAQLTGTPMSQSYWGMTADASDWLNNPLVQDTFATIGNGAKASVGNLIPDSVNGTAAWFEQFLHRDSGSLGRMDPWVNVLNPVAQDVANDLRGVAAVGLAMTPVRFGRAPDAPFNPSLANLPINTGGKTQGVLHMPGQQSLPLISGVNGPSQAVRGQGLPGFNGNQLTHVEGHAAAYMRTNNVSNAVLDINKAPCTAGSGGGCNGLLPRMLPEGATLTVRHPSGVDIYTGLPDR